jgi:hypothetical protein
VSRWVQRREKNKKGVVLDDLRLAGSAAAARWRKSSGTSRGRRSETTGWKGGDRWSRRKGDVLNGVEKQAGGERAAPGRNAKRVGNRFPVSGKAVLTRGSECPEQKTEIRSNQRCF